MQVIFFGSIGTLVETSEIQRKAFNAAFEEFGLNWYWNTGNYINMIQKPGGIQRIKEYSELKLNDTDVKKIYNLKIKYFRKYSDNFVKPREGVLDVINYANRNNIKLGFITPLSHNFCSSCNRVRVDATGVLHQCLGQSNSLDFRKILRDPSSTDVDLIESIRKAIKHKPERHSFAYDLSKEHVKGKIDRHMSLTGG